MGWSVGTVSGVECGDSEWGGVCWTVRGNYVGTY